MELCAAPLTYYLHSPSQQKITVSHNLDDVGVMNLDGKQIAGLPLSPPLGTVSFDVPQGYFTLSLMACSNNGPTVVLIVDTPFIETYGLAVNYDRVLRRACEQIVGAGNELRDSTGTFDCAYAASYFRVQRRPWQHRFRPGEVDRQLDRDGRVCD